MKMNKKGFTLIELLAVIVILAVIALIASPIILGIIEDSREASRVRSVEAYADGIETTVTTYMTLNPDVTSMTICTGEGPAADTCVIDATDEGRTKPNDSKAEKVVNYSGNAVICESASYDNSTGVVTVTNCKVGADTKNLYSGNTKDGIKGTKVTNEG